MPAAAPPPVARPASRVDPNAVLAVVAVAQFMVILDASVVNVALPTIKRHVFVVGIALFSGASLICGVSQSEGMLLVARGLQGLGGAMVSPAALSIILTTFAEGPDRNRALAVWGAIAGAGGAVGLLLGGAIVQALSWRWVFFINVPIGAVVLALAPRIVPESRLESAPEGGYHTEGAVTITLGTMVLVFTLIKADSWGWTSGRTQAGLAVAAVLIVGFVIIERRHQDPLVPLRIFSDRSLAASDATMLVVAAALFGMFFFCTLYLQQVLGYNALETGIAYLPLSLTIIGASALASRFVDRFTPKPVLVAGLLVSTAGFVPREPCRSRRARGRGRRHFRRRDHPHVSASRPPPLLAVHREQDPALADFGGLFYLTRGTPGPSESHGPARAEDANHPDDESFVVDGSTRRCSGVQGGP
jgi:predicted MFS family arabinose efflux permease